MIIIQNFITFSLGLALLVLHEFMQERVTGSSVDQFNFE